MPSVWDMKDILNIPDCKVTAFRGNSANFSEKVFNSFVNEIPRNVFSSPRGQVDSDFEYNPRTFREFFSNLKKYAN